MTQKILNFKDETLFWLWFGAVGYCCLWADTQEPRNMSLFCYWQWLVCFARLWMPSLIVIKASFEYGQFQRGWCLGLVTSMLHDLFILLYAMRGIMHITTNVVKLIYDLHLGNFLSTTGQPRIVNVPVFCVPCPSIRWESSLFCWSFGENRP